MCVMSLPGLPPNILIYGVEQKKTIAKFCNTCSVRADGLCISSPRLVGGRKAGNSNMQDFFCTTLYNNNVDFIQQDPEKIKFPVSCDLCKNHIAVCLTMYLPSCQIALITSIHCVKVKVRLHICAKGRLMPSTC